MAQGTRKATPGVSLNARALYDGAVAQARAPTLYAAMGAPDTTEGRFELLVLHLVLLIDRLERDGERETSQAVFDVFVSDLDGALREMGVGDLAVPRRMKNLIAIFYGRARAYRDAFAALPNESPLAAVIGRTLLADVPVDASPLAAFVARRRQSLACASLADLPSSAAANPGTPP